MKRILLILTCLFAPLHAEPDASWDHNHAGTILVKSAWAGLWAANAAIIYGIYSELSTSNDLRKAAATRGLSDLLQADIYKVATPNTIKLVAGGLASAAVAYVLYEEIRKQLFEEEQETSA